MDVVRVFAPPVEAPPFSLHLLLTTRCSLNCPGCFYRGTPGAWTWEEAERVTREAAALGVRWLALGGGEPTEWAHLPVLVRLARSLGLKVAITTNGTRLLDIQADRVHVSHDLRHRTSREQVTRALKHYRALGASVGVNVILDDLDFARSVLEFGVDVTFLLPKPYDRAPGLDEIRAFLNRVEDRAQVLCDSCLHAALGGECFQGRVSLALDQSGRASVCSNVPAAFRLRMPTLSSAWQALRRYGARRPFGCILSGVEQGHVK